MAQIREGITPRLDSNRWFNSQVKPRITKAYYIEADDNFHYQIVRTENPNTGKVSVLIIKVAHTGFIKSTMNMPPGLAKEIGRLLQELSG